MDLCTDRKTHFTQGDTYTVKSFTYTLHKGTGTKNYSLSHTCTYTHALWLWPLRCNRSIAMVIHNQDGVVSVWRIWMNEIHLLSSFKCLCRLVFVCVLTLYWSPVTLPLSRAWEIQTRQTGRKRRMGDKNTAKNEKHRHYDSERKRETDIQYRLFTQTAERQWDENTYWETLYIHITDRQRKQKWFQLLQVEHPPSAPAVQLLGDFVNFTQAELQRLSHSQNIMASSVYSVMQIVCVVACVHICIIVHECLSPCIHTCYVYVFMLVHKEECMNVSVCVRVLAIYHHLPEAVCRPHLAIWNRIMETHSGTDGHILCRPYSQWSTSSGLNDSTHKPEGPINQRRLHRLHPLGRRE